MKIFSQLIEQVRTKNNIIKTTHDIFDLDSGELESVRNFNESYRWIGGSVDRRVHGLGYARPLSEQAPMIPIVPHPFRTISDSELNVTDGASNIFSQLI